MNRRKVSRFSLEIRRMVLSFHHLVKILYRLWCEETATNRIDHVPALVLYGIECFPWPPDRCDEQQGMVDAVKSYQSAITPTLS